MCAVSAKKKNRVINVHALCASAFTVFSLRSSYNSQINKNIIDAHFLDAFKRIKWIAQHKQNPKKKKTKGKKRHNEWTSQISERVNKQANIQAAIVLNKYNFVNENAKTELLKISEYFSYVNSSRIWCAISFFVEMTKVEFECEKTERKRRTPRAENEIVNAGEEEWNERKNCEC